MNNTESSDDQIRTKPTRKWVLVLLYIFALIVLIVGPVITLVTGLIFRKITAYRTLVRFSGIFILIHLILIFIVILPSIRISKSTERHFATQETAHMIQIALERYAQDNCAYPENPDLLIKRGYIYPNPSNPYTDRQMELTTYDPKNIDGCIGYLPFASEGFGYDYYLIVFDNSKEPGKDIDGDGVPDHVAYVTQAGGFPIVERRRGESSNDDTDQDDAECFRVKKIIGSLSETTPPIEEAFKQLKWVWR